MRLEMGRRLFEDVVGGLVEEHVLHSGPLSSQRGILSEAHERSTEGILGDLVTVVSKLGDPIPGKRGDRTELIFAVPLAVGKDLEKPFVDRHILFRGFGRGG
jgi:hypothetical protein